MRALRRPPMDNDQWKKRYGGASGFGPLPMINPCDDKPPAPVETAKEKPVDADNNLDNNDV